MAIIGEVGRRSLKYRLLNIGIHLVLLAGAFTMIYPFLIMLSGSVKSSYDSKNFNIVPKFLVDELAFFQKHLTTKYNDRISLAAANIKEPVVSFEMITPPQPNAELVASDFESFLAGPGAKLPHYYYGVGMLQEPGVYALMLRKFRSWLKKQYGEDGLPKLNSECGTEYRTWDAILVSWEDFRQRRSNSNYTGYYGKFKEFKEKCSDSLTRYYFDIDGLFIETLVRNYGNSLQSINNALGTSYVNWSQVVLPERLPSENPELAAEWEKFVRNELSLDFIRVDSSALDTYRSFLKDRYAGSVKTLNSAYGTSYSDFSEIEIPEDPPRDARRVDWNDFISGKAPAGSISVCGIGQLYREYLRTKYPDIGSLAKAQSLGYSSFGQIRLPMMQPESNIALRNDWIDFVEGVEAGNIGLRRSSVFEYRKYISDIYTRKADLDVDYGTMSKDYEAKIAAQKDVPAFRVFPETGPEKAKADYVRAISSESLREMRILVDPASLEPDWTTFLSNRYGSVEELNRTYGLVPESFAAVPVPVKELEWVEFQRNKTFLTKEFLWRNYAMVVDTLIVNGSSAINTIIYCALAILAALLVNPLAAYALSRYRPPSAYKILLLLMLTMAFPPMVLGIPNFLMIKNLGLLNTFWALVLPGIASGYSIFLLKGFFDSLPKELFECATIDGASETVIFWQIAMTLSKPILAVIALQSFTMAYGNFMMAFLVCQNPKMWTIMVYLYDLQQRSSPAVGFAALVIAAIPTLLVFVFCQNIIIRGIVVPTEK